MESLGADAVIPGGQTMNPSTELILEAIERSGSKKVLLLPNNSNIIMAAEQAASLSQREVRVIKTTNIPQGLAAMLVHNPYGELEEVAGKMSQAAGGIRSGEITRAVRNTISEGRHINYGDYIAVCEGRILESGPDLYPAVKALVDHIVDKHTELLTLYYGADMSWDEVQSMAQSLGKEYEGLEIETHFGGQPHYQLIISSE